MSFPVRPYLLPSSGYTRRAHRSACKHFQLDDLQSNKRRAAKHSGRNKDKSGRPTGDRGGRHDKQSVTRSSEYANDARHHVAADEKHDHDGGELDRCNGHAEPGPCSSLFDSDFVAIPVAEAINMKQKRTELLMKSSCALRKTVSTTR